jgi:ABC-type polysaccharide/polyol phosphate export permease
MSLGWQDVKQAYRRSSIGPFWLTAGMAIQIATIGLVFGLIFGSPLEEFLPFLAVSLILWSFISSSISGGSMAFVAGESIIRQLSIPQGVHVLRALWQNTITTAHNLVIIPFVFIIFLKPPTVHLALIIPGFALNVVFLFSVGYLLGLITARFRDVQQIISSLLVVLFYLTPVIWQPALIPGGTAHLLLGLNPFYHFLQITRLPILGQAPTFENWAISTVISFIAGIVAYLAAKQYRTRLAYWV